MKCCEYGTWPYPKTLVEAGKPCQEATLKPGASVQRKKKFSKIDTWARSPRIATASVFFPSNFPSSLRLSSCFLTVTLSPLKTPSDLALPSNEPSTLRLSRCLTTAARSPLDTFFSVLLPSKEPSILRLSSCLTMAARSPTPTKSCCFLTWCQSC